MGSQKESLPQLLRLARRAQGLTLATVAERVKITKSALCRYEQGDMRALGRATARNLCHALDIPVPPWLAEPVSSLAAAAGPATVPRQAFYLCVTPFCLLQEAFVAGAMVRFRPTVVTSIPNADVACRFCGSSLISSCLSCDSPVAPGSSVCSACGSDYVEPQAFDDEARLVLSINRDALAGIRSREKEAPVWAPVDQAAVVRARASLHPPCAGVGKEAAADEQSS